MLDNLYLMDWDYCTYGEVRERVNNDPALAAKYFLGEDTPLDEEGTVYALKTTRFWEITP